MNRNILETILLEKKNEVVQRAAQVSLSTLQTRARGLEPAIGFVSALQSASYPAVVAEVKRASPSKGLIRADLNPVETAKGYMAAGAACLSVLTDEKFFQGNLQFVVDIKKQLPHAPLIRKDFTCHPYQVWETRASGADAILLIVAALNDEELHSLASECVTAGLDVLIEVHNREELKRAAAVYKEVFAATAPAIIGINNRDLKSFVTSLSVSEDLLSYARGHLPELAECLFISESGIQCGADAKRLRDSGAGAFLIGEMLVASGDPGDNLRRFIEEAKR